MVHNSVPPIDDVLKDLKSLLLSAPKNITARELFEDYFDVTQIRLNPRNYKFASEDDFLGAFPQFFYAVSVVHGKIQYAGISSNPSTNAVADLVNKQRNSGRKANICVNGSTGLQRSNTFSSLGPKSNYNFQPTPNKTSTDTSKPSYADFFKNPQPKLGQQLNYEPSVTISMGSDVLSSGKLGRTRSMRGGKKPSRFHPPPPAPPNSLLKRPIHLTFNKLNIDQPLSTNISAGNPPNTTNGFELRSIIEQNKSYNNQLKTSTTVPQKNLKSVDQTPFVAPTHNIDKKNNTSNGHNHYSDDNVPQAPTSNKIVPKPHKQDYVDSAAAENKELFNFVSTLRFNVKKCLDLHSDRFCSLSQLQDDYIELFSEPFHPPDMPKSDITNIFETYLGNVCMVLNDMKGVLYIKGLSQ